MTSSQASHNRHSQSNCINRILYLCVFSYAVSSQASQPSQFVLKQLEEVACDVGILGIPGLGITDTAACTYLSGFTAVPKLAVGLYSTQNGTFNPCCRDMIVTFRAQLFKGGIQIPITGQKTIDSPLGSDAKVTFGHFFVLCIH